MRIFNASMHRTATQSFAAACRANGIDCVHWLGRPFDAECRPFLDALEFDGLWRFYAPRIAGAAACADLPCPILYRQAAAAFPGARFIVVERSPAKWLASVRRHMAGRDFCVLERMAYWWLTGMRRARLGDYEESVLLAAYRTHTARALDAFRDLGVEHAVFSLEAPDFAARIADFCGFARERQFPHVDYLPAKEAAARRAMEAK